MIDGCKICGNHEDEKLCRKCNLCQRQHIQKYGIPWVQNKNIKIEPCIHICRFRLPNGTWMTYKCTKNNKHTGQCNFGVNTDALTRIARDSVGR